MRPLPHGHHGTPLIISRRTHPLVKELKLLRDQPTGKRIFLEGPRLVDEALQSSLPIELLVISTACKKSDLRSQAEHQAQKTFTVAPAVFDAFSDVEEPQGILAIGRRPVWSWDQLLKKSPAPIVVLERLQNPGNVASIVRTAEASGAAGVVTTPGTAHLFSPKALRGAMGSTLRLPILEHVPIPVLIERLVSGGCQIYGTLIDRKNELLASFTYLDIDWTQACAFVLGQEGGGISDACTPHLQKQVTIPMQNPVESLNVAAAAAVLLYEAFRQRQGWQR
jgi:TrmH family RNA methyltransferase